MIFYIFCKYAQSHIRLLMFRLFFSIVDDTVWDPGSKIIYHELHFPVIPQIGSETPLRKTVTKAFSV